MERLLVGAANGLISYDPDATTSDWLIDGPGVPTIVVDPLLPTRVYAATLGKGLWMSDDSGATFSRNEAFPVDIAWTVAVSASDRAGDFGAVYVGTQLSAIYRSTDGGVSFEELTSVQEISDRDQWSFPPAPDTHHVHQIALHPTNPDSIVFGVELGGTYRSLDRGATWTRTNADPDPHVLRVHPLVPDRMYQGGGGSYRVSEDGGSTWTIHNEGTGDEYRYFYSMVMDRADPELVLIVAGHSPFSGHGVIPGIPVFSTVFRREAGSDWEEVLEGMPPREGTTMGTLVAAEPDVFLYVTEPGTIYRSDDRGRSFELIGSVGSHPVLAKARSLAVIGPDWKE